MCHPGLKTTRRIGLGVVGDVPIEVFLAAVFPLLGTTAGHVHHWLRVVELGEVYAVASIVLLERDERHQTLAPANFRRQVRRSYLTANMQALQQRVKRCNTLMVLQFKIIITYRKQK